MKGFKDFREEYKKQKYEGLKKLCSGTEYSADQIISDLQEEKVELREKLSYDRDGVYTTYTLIKNSIIIEEFTAHSIENLLEKIIKSIGTD